MRSSPPPALYERWTQPCYERRVRDTVFLWGSARITRDLTFTKPLLLHIRNVEFGEDVTVGTQTASGVRTIIGTLQPGEYVTIPVQGVVGVFATCELESTVACIIKSSE